MTIPLSCGAVAQSKPLEGICGLCGGKNHSPIAALALARPARIDWVTAGFRMIRTVCNGMHSTQGTELKTSATSNLCIKLCISGLLSIVVLAGCKLDFAIPPNEPMHLSVYQTGHPTLDPELKAADPVAQAINRWLAANHNGWDYAYITRAPHIYLKGENFSVNFLKNEVSVKYCRGFYNCHFWVKPNSDLFPEIEKLCKHGKESGILPYGCRDQVAIFH